MFCYAFIKQADIKEISDCLGNIFALINSRQFTLQYVIKSAQE